MLKEMRIAGLGVACLCGFWLSSDAVGAQGVKPIPDFSGYWARSIFGQESPESGPGPILNLKRRPDGKSDAQQLVGDYNSPILTPRAAEIVKKHGEQSIAGIAFPDLSNQCRPMAPPYILRVQEVQLLQQKHQVIILYQQDHQYRRIRLNDSHPKDLQPSWWGDSIGHYEGGTLVVDTVGAKVGPASMVDMFGTPHSEQLHVVERYRMVSGAEAKAYQDRSEQEYGRPDGPSGDGIFVDFDYTGPGLRVEFTVEDKVMFKTPWSGAITYRKAARAEGEWEERVCAENTFEYHEVNFIPQAAKPDF